MPSSKDSMAKEPLTNYVSYLEGSSSSSRIGHLSFETLIIQPLSFLKGTIIQDLQEVIEAGEANIIADGDKVPVSSVRMLPPVSGRDVFVLGNMSESNGSGSHSYPVDQPKAPVVFRKLDTCIASDGDPIVLSPEFTGSLNYEGRIGVIVGKPGSRISEEMAVDHIWGYTITNGATALVRVGGNVNDPVETGCSYCSMGPVAVPAKHIPEFLNFTARVNGEVKRSGYTCDLLVSIPRLISTISEGQTVQTGDVLAIGTSVVAEFGKSPLFLQPGDEIEISVRQLGVLRNKVISASSYLSTPNLVEQQQSTIPAANGSKSLSGTPALIPINGKFIHYKQLGNPDGPPIIFVHGLGGTVDYYKPLISRLSLDITHSLHLNDLEGHGRSPSSTHSHISIESFEQDIKAVFDHAQVGPKSTKPVTLIGHSMGCTVALSFVLQHPGLVDKLILLGPPPSPFPEAGSKGCNARAETVRKSGMAAVVDAVVSAGTSNASRETNPVAIAIIRSSLLGQPPEGYAKACTALANSRKTALPLGDVGCQTLIVTGEEDRVSPPAACATLSASLPQCGVPVLLPGVGHWHIYEDVQGVAEAVRGFLSLVS